jgi:hypothetical protein
MENKVIWGVKLTYDDMDTRDSIFYPCESKEVAIKFLARLKKTAITDLTDWTDNNYRIDNDDEEHFCVASQDWFMFEELLVIKKDLITEDSVRPVTIEKFGRTWRYTDNDYACVEGDINWWFTAEFSEGKLYTNNVLGLLLLVGNDGTKLESDI